MKLLGKIFLILVFAAIVSLVYYWQESNRPLPSFLPSTKQDDGTQKVEYANENYGFAVMHEKRFLVDESGGQPDYFASGGVAVANISIHRSIFPNTNFSSAGITFSVKSRSNITECRTYATPASSNNRMTETIDLDAGKFYTTEITGGADGTKYITRLFRILKDTLCYELAQTVAVTNIEDAEPGTVSEVVEADVWNHLSAILVSFKFIELNTTDDANTEDHGYLEGQVDINGQSSDAYSLVQIVVYNSNRTEILRRVNLSETGEYSVSLPPGVYQVTYTSASNRIQPTVKRIQIETGETSTADFSL